MKTISKSQLKVIRLSKLIGIVATLIFAYTAAADGNHHKRKYYVPESIEVSDHQVFGKPDIVNGVTVLVRDFRNRVVTATVSSNVLEPFTAYSIWWAVFNRPRFCNEPYRCALSDLSKSADSRIKPSVFWAGGFISDAFGIANTTLRLVPGRTDRELFAKTKGYGLLNLKGAEIHVVLRSHGEAGLAGTVAKQVGTAMEACPAGGCQNVFASIHIPKQNNSK